MPDQIPFDYLGAKKAGYSDDEIKTHLKTTFGFDFDIIGAKKSGYSDKEIADYIYAAPVEKKNLGGTPSSVGGSPFPSVSETLSSSNGKKKDDLWVTGTKEVQQKSLDERVKEYVYSQRTPEEVAEKKRQQVLNPDLVQKEREIVPDTDNSLSQLKPEAKAALYGLASVASSTMKAIGVAAKQFDFFNEYGDKKAEDLATYKAGQWIEDNVKDLVGELSPEEQGRFSVKLAQGVGQMGGFLLGGLGGKLIKASPILTTAGLGAAVSGASEYDAAIQSGATPEQAAKAFWLNTAIGTTEVLPIMGAFRKLDKYTGGLATGTLAMKLASTAGGRITNEIAQGIVTETAQEMGQQIMSNVVAKNTYDATRRLFDGVLESGGIAAIIGGSMRGAIGSIREKRQAGNLTQKEEFQLAQAEKFAEKKLEEATNPDKNEVTTPTPQNKKVKSIIKAKTDIEADLASNTTLPEETRAIMQSEVEALDQELETAKTEAYQEELNQSIKADDQYKERIDALNDREDLTPEQKEVEKEKIMQEHGEFLKRQEQEDKSDVVVDKGGGDVGLGDKPIWELTQDESYKVNGDFESGEGLVSHVEMAAKTLKGLEDGESGITKEGNTIVYRDENGKPIGYAKLDKNGVRELGVDENSRNKGIASKITNWLKEQGITDKLLPPFSKEGNIVSHRNEVKKALEAGKYQKAVDKGEMTIDEANKIIESAGLKSLSKQDSGGAEPVTKSEDVVGEQKTETNETINQQGDKGNQPIPPEEKSQPEEGAIETPPPQPPSEEGQVEGEGTPELKNKSFATRVVEAKNTPQAAKEGIAKEGLKYEPQSQEEAEGIAKSIIDELGMDEAVSQAQKQNFGGDVNTLIQTKALDMLYDQETKATSSEDKFKIAEKFADVAIKLDEWARDKAGRGVAALNYFYKKSPLGMVIKQNRENKKNFDRFAKPNEKSWDEFLAELNELPEFKEFVSKEVQQEMKKERAEERKTRIKKVDDTIDGWIKDIENGKTLFSTPVPPPIIIAALKGAKAAYKAGEHIAKIIEDAIAFITEKVGDSDWNIEGLKKKLESLYGGGDKKNSLDRYKDSLNRQIADLDRQINDRKRDNKKKNKTELDEEAKELIEKRDEKKKQLEEINPLSETEDYQIRQLEKFRKRLKGLSEAQKDEVIRKSFQELIKNGALEQEDFRKIIAQATGRGDLTAEQSAKMKELVKQTNSVEVFAKRLRERKTPQSLKNYHNSQMKAAKAARELSDMFDKKSDYLKVIAAAVQGNTLSLTNVAVLNPLFNIVNQLSTRLPIGALQSIYGIISGQAQFNTALSPSAQKQFFKELFKGLKEANVQLVTGMNRLDYDSKEIFTDQIRPFKSAKELWHQVRSSQFGNAVARMMGKEEVERKEQLTSRQKVHRALQIFPGTTAELIFRLLNYGDKPMRFGAGGATAAAFSNSLGINPKSIDWDIFLEFPREEAYRILKSQGKTEKEASERADYIKESIGQEAKRSTFQQDNIFADKINQLFGGSKKSESGAASLAKASLVSPYIKIPSNAFWSFFNVAHPVIAVAQSTGHLINSKRLRSNGENVKADLQIREARYWAGHAAVGIALQMVLIPLIKSGIITAGSDEDDPKKEREGKRTYEQQGTIKISGTTIPLKFLGHVGMLGNSMAKDWEEMTPEQRENQDLLIQNLFEFWDTDDLKELQNGVFSNSAGLLGALGEGGSNANRFFINQINMYANLVQPAALAQISRAQLPYYTIRKSDSFAEELEKSFLERSSLYRKLKDKYPPSKINIWGEPMMKDKSFVFKMLGFNMVNKDIFAQPIYEDAKKYNDANFFPPAVDDKFRLAGKTIELNADQQRDLEVAIGKARRILAEPYINDGLPIYEEKTYSNIEDTEQATAKDIKLKKLKKIYSAGRKVGLIDFLRKYHELIPVNPIEEPEKQTENNQ